MSGSIIKHIFDKYGYTYDDGDPRYPKYGIGHEFRDVCDTIRQYRPAMLKRGRDASLALATALCKRYEDYEYELERYEFAINAVFDYPGQGISLGCESHVCGCCGWYCDDIYSDEFYEITIGGHFGDVSIKNIRQVL